MGSSLGTHQDWTQETASTSVLPFHRSSTFEPSIFPVNSFNWSPDLLPHFDVVVQNQMVSKKPGMKYVCPVCSKEFYDKNKFRRHYMIHTGEKPFACTHCTYRSNQMCSLKLHLQTKHNSLFHEK